MIAFLKSNPLQFLMSAGFRQYGGRSSVLMGKQIPGGMRKIALLAFAIALFATPMAFAAKGGGNSPALVVTTASWCGTCREIIPIVTDIASASSLSVVTLDVDKSNAPDEASQYGIAVTGGELPEVYLFKNGKTTLLFNGKGYRIGQSAQAKSQIQGRLQGSL
jgi:thiol-disulfide isomerase/thioredoxin